MLRNLIHDLESALRMARRRSAARPCTGPAPASRPQTPAASRWLPYRAYLEDRQVFVNRDALGFCLELRPQSGADEEMARVLTALYAASPPAPVSSSTCCASPAIRAPLARYADLRLPDDVVPELDTLGRAGRHTNIHRTMARRRRGTTCRAAGHRCSPPRATCSATSGWWSASRFPAAPRTSRRLDELLLLRDGIRATLHAAGFPSRSWTANDLINWVSALLDPHRQTGEGIPLTYDDGRELRDQVIDRATRLRIDRQGIGLGQPGRRPADRASPDVGARLPAALRAVERRQPDRRPLPGHAAVPLPLPAHAGRARARRRGHPQLGLPQGRPRHHQRHQLHGALPARPAGAQGRLGHRAEGHGRRPAARRPQPARWRSSPSRTRSPAPSRRRAPSSAARGFELSQRHDDDDAGPHRLAADDALGAVPRGPAAA